MRKREQISITLPKELIKKIEKLYHPDMPFSRKIERVLKLGLSKIKK